jgi:predicted 3-demethylubiquinone-9 3-methyltransferase (glyoxalase superfamily)
MQKITTFLWFDNQAEEAARFYTGIFPNSEVLLDNRLDSENSPGGTVTVVRFKLEGQEFLALNGGPMFKFTPAISLMVSCETQEEVDELWSKLLEGGEESQCGWLTDKYGLSWQITPRFLMEQLADPDRAKAHKVFEAMMQMRKIDIPTLRRAYEEG